MRIRSLISHSAQAIAEGALIALMVVGLIAGTAFAAHGRTAGTTSGSISVSYMDGATEAHFGARVTFKVATTATAYPYVHLRCFKGSTLVLESWQGFFPTAMGHQWLYLGPSPLWQSGAADCTANLEKSGKRGSWTVLNATTFHVYE